MRCHQCGTDNPEQNNFCGNCGARLEHAKVGVAEPLAGNGRPIEPALPVSYWEDVIPPSEAEPEPEAERVVQRRSEPTTISGPSFLGLTDSPESDQSSYLLDDDKPRRGRGLLVFCLFAIAIFAGIGYIEWQTIKTGRLSIPFISKPAGEQPAKATAPAPAQNPATEAANPQSDNPDSLATSDNDNSNGPVNPVPGAAAAPSAKPSSPTTTSETTTNDTSPQAATNQRPKSTGQATAAASDQDATEASQSRQVKDADQQPSANDEADSEKTGPAKKAKPSARTASFEKAPDPRENRMLLLGERYLYGHGVPQNCNQALVYFRGAAEENNAPAMAHLGAMYASGQCVTLNRVTAFNWFARAQNAQPSDPWLQRNMNMLWRDMTPQERTAINK